MDQIRAVDKVRLVEHWGALDEKTASKDTLLVDGKKQPLTSGLSVTTKVKVGQRRIIEFFIYPLIKHLDEGMSVR